MARWVIQVNEEFAPLYVALETHLLEQVVVQADEMLLNVLKEDKQCYMLLYCSGADSPDAALPNVKNIALYDAQGCVLLPSWVTTVVICKLMATVLMTDLSK